MRTTRTIVQLLALTLVVAAGLATAAPAGADVLTPNLVQNPGAEKGGSGLGGVVTTIPSWSRGPEFGSSRSTVVDYGTAGFPTRAQAAALDGGSQFFAGGPFYGPDDNSVDYSEAVIGQDIAIPADVMNLVQSGGAQVTFSACLGGYADQDDYVEMKLYQTAVSFSYDRQPGEATITGPRAAGRGGTTALLPVSNTYNLPPTVTMMGIRLDFVRTSGAATYNDGYADNVSVRISTAGSVPPAPHCSPDPSTVPGGGTTPAPPGPTTPGGPKSSTGGTNTALPLARVGKRLKLQGGATKLKLRCVARDSACKGSVSLTTQLGKLGSAKFRIGAGKVGTIKVKIGRKMRHRLAALSRKRFAKLKITATARIGTETTKFTFGVTR
jgi:hypothetical protein